MRNLHPWYVWNIHKIVLRKFHSIHTWIRRLMYTQCLRIHNPEHKGDLTPTHCKRHLHSASVVEYRDKSSKQIQGSQHNRLKGHEKRCCHGACIVVFNFFFVWGYIKKSLLHFNGTPNLPFFHQDHIFSAKAVQKAVQYEIPSINESGTFSLVIHAALGKNDTSHQINYYKYQYLQQILAAHFGGITVVEEPSLIQPKYYNKHLNFIVPIQQFTVQS